MRRIWLWMGALLLWIASAAQGAAKIEKVTYHGWTGAYRLSNGTVELVVVPSIGRIMRYGFVGGPNVLWEKRQLRGKVIAPSPNRREWVNYGGDKLWNAPQARWNWPPDVDLDGSPYTPTVLPGGVLRMTGPKSRKTGIRFLREIRLDATGTGVIIRNTMENVGDQIADWSVWEVAQVDAPDYAALPLNREGRFSRGYYLFRGVEPAAGQVTLVGREVRIRRSPKRGSKIGGDAPEGAIYARKGGLKFIVSAAYEPNQEYPDDGCAQEIWTNPDPDKYMELELLSPIQYLQPGERYTFTTRWRLERSVK